MEERRLRYEDDPQNSLYENVVASAFEVHPYRWPVIGWMSDLKNIRPEDLRKHYMEYYSPDNASIVVAGDVNAEDIFKKADEYFGGIKPTSGRRILKSVEPPQKGERTIYLEKEAELPYMIAAYHVPRFPDKDSYALDVLAQILSGKSGRLYRSLVYEDKLAIDASAGNSGISVDPFLFLLDATAAPGEDIEDVEESLFAQIDTLKTEPPSAEELQREADETPDTAETIQSASVEAYRRLVHPSWRADAYYDPAQVKPDQCHAVGFAAALVAPNSANNAAQLACRIMRVGSSRVLQQIDQAGCGLVPRGVRLHPRVGRAPLGSRLKFGVRPRISCYDASRIRSSVTRRSIMIRNYGISLCLALILVACSNDSPAGADSSAAGDLQKPVQENVDVAETSDAKGPFEMPVADVFNITGQGVVITGRVTSGSISVGESVCIAGGSPVTIKGIEMMRETLESISAGDMGGLMLEGISKDDISKGDIVRSCG